MNDKMFILLFFENNKSKQKLQCIKHEMVEANNACGAERSGAGRNPNTYIIKLSPVALKRKLDNGDRYPWLRSDLSKVSVQNETNIVLEP
jgi:hypothetical protein